MPSWFTSSAMISLASGTNDDRRSTASIRKSVNSRVGTRMKEGDKQQQGNIKINIIFFSLLDSDWLKSVPINP